MKTSIYSGRGATLALAGALALVAALSACGISVKNSVSGATTTVATSATTAPLGTPTLATPPTSTVSSPPPVLACTASHLVVSTGTGGAGLGHVGIPILFTNIGSSECTLYGYPGVATLNQAGQQVVQATRSLSGYLGGLNGTTTIPTVDLAPDGTASALIESTDNPIGPATSCPTYTSFLVTPPDTTTSVPVTTSLIDCSGIEVHPVVSGSSGSQGE